LGYRVVAGFQLLMSLAFVLTLSWWADQHREITDDRPREKRLTDYKTSLTETIRQPRVWLSVLLFFLYVGTETSLGIWAYSLLTESRGVAPGVAGLLTGSYWATFTIGRILAGLYAKRAGIDLLVQVSLGFALFGAVLLWWNPFPLANLLAVTVVGFAIAPIFPALISGTSRRVGVHYAANTIGMQMAVTGLGASLIPSLMGVLADRFSLEIVPVCLSLMFLTFFVLYRVSMTPRNQEEYGHAA
jgi:fucose permease